MICRVGKPQGNVFVRYLSFHNHECETTQLPHVQLHKSVGNKIKSLLENKVSVEAVLEECMGDFGERTLRGSQRIEKEKMLNCEEIRNIGRNMTRPTLGDVQLCRQLLGEYAKEPYNPVLIWKPPSRQAEIGSSYLDHFKSFTAIGLQTKQQLEMMMEGGQRILCIDATHGINM